MSRRGAARSLLALTSLIFLAGSIVLLFLVILAGAFDRHPLNRIFFLQADTKGIPNAPQGLAHWTLYNVCQELNGVNHLCGKNQGAFPMVPQQNFGTPENVPSDFLNNDHKYFYLSRFTFAFYIITLFFATCSLFTGLAAICTGVGGLVASIFSWIAFLSMAFTASIMTACYVMAQNAFRREGRFARVGVKAMAFTWTTVLCLFLSALGFLAAYLAHRRGRGRDHGSVRHESTVRTGRFTSGIHRHRRDTSEESAYTREIKPDDRASYETSESQRHFLNRDSRVGPDGRGYEGGGYIGGAEGATGRT